MNRTVLLAMAVLTALLFASCREGSGFVAPTGWKSTGAPADSLTREIELAMLFEENPDSIERLVGAYASSAPAGPERDSRLHFWEGRLAMRRGNRELRNAKYDSAMSVAPTGTDEYLRHRLLWMNERRQDFSAVEWYSYKLGEVKYYESRKDYVMLYMCYNDLMGLMRDLGLKDKARQYFALCDSVNAFTGERKSILDHKINEAALLSDDGRFEEAAALNREISEDSLFMLNTLTYQLVNFNLYVCDLDTAALYKAYRSLLAHGDRQGLFPKVYIFLTLDAAWRGDGAVANAFADTLAPLAAGMPTSRRKQEAYKALALARELGGDREEALEAYRRYAAVSDTLVQELRNNNIAGMETAAEIRAIDERMERERRSGRVRLLAVGGFALLALGVCVVYFERRAARLRRQRMAAEHRQLAVQLNSDRRSLALEKAAENLRDMKNRGTLSPGEASALERILSDRGFTEIGSADFMELFSRQYPLFISRLREISPRISDSAVRLAGYISIGLGTKEISELMNVRPESVRQARWRLRKTLGLEDESELFPMLSRMLGEGSDR